MKRAVLILVLLCFGTTSAFASPYPLDQMLPEDAAKKLAAQGANTSTDLLDKGKRRRGRRKLAKTTGLALPKITEWVHLCDLLRVNGVGPMMARLLAAAKVSTIAKLKRQKAPRLLKKLLAANEKNKITENPPDEALVADWIAQAKKLKVVLR